MCLEYFEFLSGSSMFFVLSQEKELMPNDYFKFKQFIIWQELCAMKVGTDGVLLGAWATVSGRKRILDIGTGTGLLALMMAQRSNAEIKAIEVDPDATGQAMKNIGNSNWNERISVEHISFQKFAENGDEKQFDLILTNPPYFQNSLKAPDEKRSLARHNDSLPFDDLLRGVEKLLTHEGRFAIILPYLEGSLFIAKAVEYSLYCVRKTNVYGTSNSPVKRILCEFEKNQQPIDEKDLIIEKGKRHEYTKTYIELTRDFYLKF